MGNIINCDKKPVNEKVNPMIIENKNKNDYSVEAAAEDEKVKNIIEELEQDGYKKLGELNKKFMTSTVDDLKKEQNTYAVSLLSIIKDGTNEFEKKTGRQMTYAEMRSVYG